VGNFLTNALLICPLILLKIALLIVQSVTQSEKYCTQLQSKQNYITDPARGPASAAQQCTSP